MFEKMLGTYRLEDQTTLNDNLHMCNHRMLSRKFFTFAHSKLKVWDGIEDFDIPRDIVSHHANWVVGVANKIKIMNITRDKYNKMKEQ